MRSDNPPPRAFQLSRRARQVLVVAAFLLLACALTGAWLFRKYTSSPTLLWASLGIGAMVSAGVAIIGRLPAGFEIGGMDLTFHQADLSDFITTLRNSIDESDVTERLLTQLKEAVGPTAFEKARRQADRLYGSAATAAPDNASSATAGSMGAPDSAGGSSPEEYSSVEGMLESLADAGSFERGFTVATSNRGNPPKFDFALTIGGQRLAVEQERYWSPTVLDLVTRRIERTLSHSDDVSGVVVFCPTEGVREFEQAIDGARVEIVASDGSLASAKEQIRRFAARLQGAPGSRREA